MELNIIGLFCEDIREELAGTQSLMGIMPDNISVVAVPAALAKLGFYIRVHAPLDAKLSSTKIVVREPGGREIELPPFDQAVIADARKQAKANGTPYLGLVMRGMASPFQVSTFGRVNLVVTLDGVERLAGSLNIVEQA